MVSPASTECNNAYASVQVDNAHLHLDNALPTAIAYALLSTVSASATATSIAPTT